MATRITGRAFVVAALVAVLAIVGGAANAAWAPSGSGTASTGTLVISLSPGTPSSSIYPGGQANVILTATNPNPEIVKIGSLALDTSQGTGGFAVDASHVGCAVAALTFATQNNAGNGWSVPAKSGTVNGSLAITLTNALSMAGTAANACQGAIFTVYLVVGA